MSSHVMFAVALKQNETLQHITEHLQRSLERLRNNQDNPFSHFTDFKWSRSFRNKIIEMNIFILEKNSEAEQTRIPCKSFPLSLSISLMESLVNFRLKPFVR